MLIKATTYRHELRIKSLINLFFIKINTLISLLRMFRNLFLSIGKNVLSFFCVSPPNHEFISNQKARIKHNLTPWLALETLRKVSDEVKEKQGNDVENMI